MHPKSKKKRKDKTRAKWLDRLPSWVQEIILFLYGVSLFRIGAIIVCLIVVVIVGDLFTMDGLVLVLCLLVFLILFGLKMKFEKDDET